jgi:hypothetical protein
VPRFNNIIQTLLKDFSMGLKEQKIIIGVKKLLYTRSRVPGLSGTPGTVVSNKFYSSQINQNNKKSKKNIFGVAPI